MKTLLALLLFVGSTLFCKAQTGATDTTNIQHRIKKQAEIMGNFFIKEDYQSFVKYNYPDLIDMMGGAKKMAGTLEKMVNDMKSQGAVFSSIKFGQPFEFVRTEDELQCLIPQTLEMKVPNGRMVTVSALIAVSKDEGENWYFIDTGGKDMITVKQIVPTLSNELILPPKQGPIFYRD